MSAYSPIDLEHALELRLGADAGLNNALVTGYGVEVLTAGAWRPLRRLFGQLHRFATEDEAVTAAVSAWRRSDRPARPFPLMG